MMMIEAWPTEDSSGKSSWKVEVESGKWKWKVEVGSEKLKVASESGKWKWKVKLEVEVILEYFSYLSSSFLSANCNFDNFQVDSQKGNCMHKITLKPFLQCCHYFSDISRPNVDLGKSGVEVKADRADRRREGEDHHRHHHQRGDKRTRRPLKPHVSHVVPMYSDVNWQWHLVRRECWVALVGRQVPGHHQAGVGQVHPRLVGVGYSSTW